MDGLNSDKLPGKLIMIAIKLGQKFDSYENVSLSITSLAFLLVSTMFFISIRKHQNDVPYSFENFKIFVQYRSRSLIYSLTQKNLTI